MAQQTAETARSEAGAAQATADEAIARIDVLGFNGSGDAAGANAVSLGAGASAAGDHAIAIGTGAQAVNGAAVAMGLGSVASGDGAVAIGDPKLARSEEHTSELQSLMRLSYAVVCLKKKNTTPHLRYSH